MAPRAASRLAVPRRLTHADADGHRGQRKQRTGGVGGGPSVACRHDEREGTRRRRPDPPAVLRHARTDAKLARFEQLDAIGVDDDVERRTGNADEHCGECDRRQGLLWIEASEKDDGGHHKHAGHPQPRAALAEAAEQRDANGVDERRPQELEVVGEKGQREHGDRAFLDPVLCEPRGQRGADHRERCARRDTQEQRRQRRGFEVGTHAFRKIRAPVAGDDRGFCRRYVDAQRGVQRSKVRNQYSFFSSIPL